MKILKIQQIRSPRVNRGAICIEAFLLLFLLTSSIFAMELVQQNENPPPQDWSRISMHTKYTYYASTFAHGLIHGSFDSCNGGILEFLFKRKVRSYLKDEIHMQSPLLRRFIAEGLNVPASAAYSFMYETPLHEPQTSLYNAQALFFRFYAMKEMKRRLGNEYFNYMMREPTLSLSMPRSLNRFLAPPGNFILRQTVPKLFTSSAAFARTSQNRISIKKSWLAYWAGIICARTLIKPFVDRFFQWNIALLKALWQKGWPIIVERAHIIIRS